MFGSRVACLRVLPFVRRGMSVASVPLDHTGNPIISHDTEEVSSGCGSSCGSERSGPLPALTQFNLPQMQEEFMKLGLEKYRAKQVYGWIYDRGVDNFDQMTDIKKSVRELQSKTYELYSPSVTHVAKSTDGTRKYLYKVPERAGKGSTIETVFIPGVGEHNVVVGSQEQVRKSGTYVGYQRDAQDSDLNDVGVYSKGSICLSSQIGCSLQCAFCHTGTMPKSELRNLTVDELLGQFLLVKNDLPPHSITNIVMMGMGEPLYNFKNLKAFLQIIMDPQGLGMSKRRITVSTSGVVTMFPKLAELGVNLAVSLHSARPELRDVLVPLNKVFPLNSLMEACEEYSKATNMRTITFEYIMLADVTDTYDDVDALVKLLAGRKIDALVNLIPFNLWPGSGFHPSRPDRIQDFKQAILDHPLNRGIRVSVRTPRGRDILAACGQLAVVQNSKKLLPTDKEEQVHSILQQRLREE